MRATRLTLAVALGVLTLAAASCGGGGNEAVGTTETTTTETTTETTTGTPAAGSTLLGTVGPGFTIDLRTQDGQAVSALAAGTYTIEVDDKADIHNFHLTGPGVDVSTSVGGEGMQSFQVTLQPGTYRFVCDPHSSTMNGDFEVSG